jgi:hypothetical protein
LHFFSSCTARSALLSVSQLCKSALYSFFIGSPLLKIGGDGTRG